MKQIIYYILLLLIITSCSRDIIVVNNPINQVENNIKNGIWIYNEDTTDMLIIENYIDGNLHGKYYKFFPNGNIAVSGNYYYGKKNKKWKYYYSDGQLGTIQKYKKGKIKKEKINNISW